MGQIKPWWRSCFQLWSYTRRTKIRVWPNIIIVLGSANKCCSYAPHRAKWSTWCSHNIIHWDRQKYNLFAFSFLDLSYNSGHFPFMPFLPGKLIPPSDNSSCKGLYYLIILDSPEIKPTCVYFHLDAQHGICSIAFSLLSLPKADTVRNMKISRRPQISTGKTYAFRFHPRRCGGSPSC